MLKNQFLNLVFWQSEAFSGAPKECPLWGSDALVKRRGEMTLVWRSDAHPEFCHVKNMYEDFDFKNFAIVSIIGN